MQNIVDATPNIITTLWPYINVALWVALGLIIAAVALVVGMKVLLSILQGAERIIGGTVKAAPGIRTAFKEHPIWMTGVSLFVAFAIFVVVY